MYNLIPRVPSDIAANKLAVHAYNTTGDLVSLYLCSREFLEALLKEIHMVSARLLILTDLCPEEIIGRRGGTLVIQVEKSKSLAPQQVVSAILKQLLIRATCTFLEDVHGNKLTDVLSRSVELLGGV